MFALFYLSEFLHFREFDSFSWMSLPLDLVKAPQQVKAALRRLEQVQGLWQNAARVWLKVNALFKAWI